MRWRSLSTTTATLARYVLSATSILSRCVSTASTLNNCQVCAATNSCSRAYKGEPGQYCGMRYNASNVYRECCCPAAMACRPNSDSCWCDEPNESVWSSWVNWFAYIVVPAVFAGALGTLCKISCKKPRPAKPGTTGSRSVVRDANGAGNIGMFAYGGDIGGGWDCGDGDGGD